MISIKDKLKYSFGSNIRENVYYKILSSVRENVYFNVCKYITQDVYGCDDWYDSDWFVNNKVKKCINRTYVNSKINQYVFKQN